MREVVRPLLAERTTLHLGGPALAELLPENEEDAQALPERVRHWGGRPFVIGAGSNLLVRDEAQPLTLIRPRFCAGPEIVGEEDGRVLVRVGAGVPLPRLLRFCAARGRGAGRAGGHPRQRGRRRGHERGIVRRGNLPLPACAAGLR